MIYLNIKAAPGWSINYNNIMTADWNAPSRDRWTVPLGLGVSRTQDLGAGYGLDLGIGAYWLAERPSGGADWQLRFHINVVIPHSSSK